ncbi:unnamed protein product [Clonostachys chloroleuca]|uniref:C6 transcription factor n=1 Tax=Clonostachys chloroleuca TaxID=1926264 RepID=A0AA35Q1M6_9HYPO|nr:unnamed protein product [Clonostachys chloroleuca]
MPVEDVSPPGWRRARSNDWASNPKYIELQEELRSGFSTITSGITSLASSPTAAPGGLSISRSRVQSVDQGYDFTRVAIPKSRLCMYLSHWHTECAPLLDKFDEAQHFGVHLPVAARKSPALFYALLAFSARHYERTFCPGDIDDTLELYQESIRLLVPALQTGDDNVLGAACILACLELMSNGSHDWRRHAQGCASLFLHFNVNGFSTGLQQAIFWCYARMDLCGAIMSYGANSTVLPLDYWVPAAGFGIVSQDDYVRTLFAHRGSESPDMYANWVVYLCAQACDFLHRQTQYLEMGRLDDRDREPFDKQWVWLWEELQHWYLHRPPAIHPIYECSTTGSECFPEILFTHWAAISSTQLYHTACLILIDTRVDACVPDFPPSSGQPFTIARWHARRICGISMANPHPASLVNAVQPLYVAGRLMTHPEEHLAVARLLKHIETMTGWSAIWRLADLEREWGYEPGEIS